MKFTVGLQFTNEAFLDCIVEQKEHIDEVYFSWGDFPNGRSNQLSDADLTGSRIRLVESSGSTAG